MHPPTVRTCIREDIRRGRTPTVKKKRTTRKTDGMTGLPVLMSPSEQPSKTQIESDRMGRGPEPESRQQQTKHKQETSQKKEEKKQQPAHGEAGDALEVKPVRCAQPMVDDRAKLLKVTFNDIFGTDWKPEHSDPSVCLMQASKSTGTPAVKRAKQTQESGHA